MALELSALGKLVGGDSCLSLDRRAPTLRAAKAHRCLRESSIVARPRGSRALRCEKFGIVCQSVTEPKSLDNGAATGAGQYRLSKVSLTA